MGIFVDAHENRGVLSMVIGGVYKLLHSSENSITSCQCLSIGNAAVYPCGGFGARPRRASSGETRTPPA